MTQQNVEPPFSELEKLLSLHNQNQLEEARTLASELTAKFPTHAFAWKVLGAVLQQQGKRDESLIAKRKAVELQPNDAEAHSNLGRLLLEQNLLEEAEAICRKALVLDPNHLVTHKHLGLVLKKLNRKQEAIESFRQFLIAENNPYIRINLAMLLTQLGRSHEVIALYKKYPPTDSIEYVELGAAFLRTENIDKAQEAFEKRLQQEAECVLALTNLAKVFTKKTRLKEAQECYTKLLSLVPERLFFDTYTSLLFTITHNDEHDSAFYLQQAKQYGQKVAEKIQPFSSLLIDKNKHRKLKIGFVSGDFCDHAVSTFILNLLQHFNCNRFELVAYYTNTINDSITTLLKKDFSAWRDVQPLTNLELAEQIKNDRIDILIDLSGHTAKNRLPMFAYKPAPIQISWIGFPASTGLDTMDYYLVESDWCPEGLCDDHFVEKLVRLPSCCTFNIPNNSIVDAPALINGYLTFGSFNRPSKLTQKTLDLWCRVLNALPDSKMVLGNVSEGNLRTYLENEFSSRGVAVERLLFHPRKSMTAYLELHSKVDLILDTIPYAGGTTTGLALSMGVPILTYAGDNLVGRAGVSWLSTVNLQHEFVANTPEQFVEIAQNWSQKINELQILRHSLRQRLQDSPKLKPENVAAGLEAAFQIMWGRYCDGLPVDSFSVSNDVFNKKDTVLNSIEIALKEVIELQKKIDEKLSFIDQQLKSHSEK